MRGSGRLALAALLLLLGQAGGTAARPVITLPDGAKIIAEGDSLTYGQDQSPTGVTAPINGASENRSATPDPEALQSDLGGHVLVLNHGYPGDRSVDGLIRWQDDPPAQVVIIMYGTNDTGDFRQHGDGRLTPDTYRRVLLALINRRQEAGAQVVVMAPPPAQDAAIDKTIAPFRLAAREAVKQTGADFLDADVAIHALPHAWTDGLHLSPAGHQALAKLVSQALQVSPP